MDLDWVDVFPIENGYFFQPAMLIYRSATSKKSHGILEDFHEEIGLNFSNWRVEPGFRCNYPSSNNHGSVEIFAPFGDVCHTSSVKTPFSKSKLPMKLWGFHEQKSQGEEGGRVKDFP